MYNYRKIYITSLDNPKAVQFSKSNRMCSDELRGYCWTLVPFSLKIIWTVNYTSKFYKLNSYVILINSIILFKTSSYKMEHLHPGLQMYATGWTKISQNDGLEEEVHRTATSPGLLNLLSWHQWQEIFCENTLKAKCVLRITKILVTSKPQ